MIVHRDRSKPDNTSPNLNNIYLPDTPPSCEPRSEERSDGGGAEDAEGPAARPGGPRGGRPHRSAAQSTAGAAPSRGEGDRRRLPRRRPNGDGAAEDD